MGLFEDAKSLVEHAEKELPTIEAEYKASLAEKTVRANLLIEIKNLMENLRSALDFSAHGIFDKYGSSKKGKPSIYFPYAHPSQTLSDFQKQKRIDACIPGLSASRPDIVKLIEDYQHFADPSNEWLPVFMALNNENKHQQLTPQTRTERKELKISSGGSTISIGEGASISMGPGASMSIGNMNIIGGQKIDVNNPPVTRGPGKTEIITWVSFHFTSNNRPVMPFLKQTVEGVKKIVDELSRL